MMGQNIYNRISEQTGRVGEESREVVEHYPISSALVAFGLGVAAGVALVSILCEESDSYDTGSYSKYAQRIGRQIMDAVSNVHVPEAVKKVWST